MKVIHVATQVAGGAGRAALRLHQGLLRLGVDSQMLVLRPSTEPGVVEFRYDSSFGSRVHRYFRRKLHRRRGEAIRRAPQPRFEEFNLDTSSTVGRDLLPQLASDAVINLHWVAGLVNYTEFFPFLGQRKVFWTLHDMNPFTGGCHFDNNCGRFVDQCGRCPQLGSHRDADLSRQIWQRKHKSLSELASDQLHIVSPSRWLKEQAQASSLFRNRPATVIPYGIDTKVFSPVDRAAARAALGLPADARIVLFVAAAVTNPRKGASHLYTAIREVKLDRLFLLSVGAKAPSETAGVAGKHLGEVNRDEVLAQVYSAADVFVIPSLADNLPNTIMEAMACGTPVVGYGAGGIVDLVIPEKTGLWVQTGNVAALSEAIQRMLSDDNLRRHCADQCRQTILANHTLDLQAQRYADLYRANHTPHFTGP